MQRFRLPTTVSSVVATLILTACVTINVYFPAAEAKEAAKEFVEKVIGDEVEGDNENPSPAPPGGMAQVQVPWQGLTQPLLDHTTKFDPWTLLGVAPAYAQAQADITIKTPAIQAIQSRMEGRFDSVLDAHFSSGALGFTSDGLVSVRDASKIALKDRVAVNQAVADQNRDAKAVYREVAVANQHPEWETQIREVFAKQWIASAKPGWWYQSASGGWKQK